MSTIRKIFKSGNSLVISIPEYLLNEFGLEDGKYVKIERLIVDEKAKGLQITKSDKSK